MVLYHGQDVFQIVERTQVIRLCGFCNAVDDRTGFCAVYTIDQLPCMFVQAEAQYFESLLRSVYKELHADRETGC